jgi:uncharacterized membrane protein YccC
MTTAELVSEILRGAVALIVIAGYVYMLIIGATIPDGFSTVLAAVLGFYFGIGSAITGVRLARMR